MKREEIKELIQKSKRLRTSRLLEAQATLREMIDERELTKSMYFWSPSGSAGGRRWNEKKRNIEITAKLTGCTVHYERSYSESCRYVYASDYLYINIDGENQKVTVADLKKMIAEIDVILEKRGTSKPV